MVTKERTVLKHTDGRYLSRLAVLTTSLDYAMRFVDIEDASEWLLNSVHAPEDTENYSYVTVEITIKVKEESQ